MHDQKVISGVFKVIKKLLKLFPKFQRLVEAFIRNSGYFFQVQFSLLETKRPSGQDWYFLIFP